MSPLIGQLAASLDIRMPAGGGTELCMTFAAPGVGGTAPLLTRSVRRDTGEERWLLTKATLLDGAERLAVNVIEDVTETQGPPSRR